MALTSDYKQNIRKLEQNTLKIKPQEVTSALPKWQYGEIHLFLWILVMILGNLNSVYCYQCLQFDSQGTTIPQGDINLQEGDSLQIDCIINKTNNYTVHDLRFENGSSPMNPEYTRFVNDTMLRLLIPNATPSASKINCFLNDTFICNNVVNVGTIPKDVEDFQCIFYDWESLNCTWRGPQNYLKVTYNLWFNIPESRGDFRCPSINYIVKTGYYNCIWNSSSTPQYHKMTQRYTLHLRGQNFAGNNTQVFRYNHLSSIMPSAPINLRFNNRTAHSVRLSWELSFSMENFRNPPGLEHRIMYKMESDEENKWHHVDASHLPQKGERSLNLTGLCYAYQFYDVRIYLKVKSSPNDEKYLSKFAYVTFRTLAELPARPPKTEIGSFEIPKATSSKRDLYVYWEQIDSNEKNGGNFTYRITHIEENGVSVTFTPHEITNTYAFYRGISLKALNFTIASWNDEGYSRRSSYVYVPNQADVVPTPTSFSKIAYGNGTYQLEWHSPQIKDLDDYTIFWCENARDRPYQCNGQIYSKKIPRTENVTCIDVDESKVFQFAISANSGHYSSGMMWASCTIIPGRALSKMSNVWVNSVKSTYIDVGWSLGCTDSGGVVQAYNITYCPNPSGKYNPCEGSQQQYTIINDTSKSMGRIENLTPYTTYAIQIAPISTHGIGVFSDPLQNVTSEDAPTPPINVKISQITNVSMLITWEPPSKMNGRLKNYIINYNEMTMNIENNDITEMKLVNLSSYTNYTVTVQACTVRCSNLSDRIVVRTAFGKPGIIEKPTLVRSETSQQSRLVWESPKNPGGFLDTYEIKVIKNFNDGRQSPENLTTTALEYKFPRLMCNEEGVEAVIFKVRGINYDTSQDHGIAAFVGANSVQIENDTNGPFNITYKGIWSEESSIGCMTSSNVSLYWIYGLVVLVVPLFMLALIILGRKGWYKLKAMLDVEISLPAGLDATSDKETTKYPLSNWNTQMKGKDDKFSVKPSSDAISLLPNKALGNGKDLSGSSENTDSTTLSLTSNKDCYNAKDILDNEENLSENTSNNSPNYSSQKPNYPIPLDQQYNSPYLKVTPAVPPLGNYTKGPWADLNYFGSLDDVDDDSISQNASTTPYSDSKKQDKMFGDYVLGMTPQTQYECPNYGKAAILPQPVFFNPTFRQTLPAGYVQHAPTNDFISRPQTELPPAVSPVHETNKMPTGYVLFDDPSAKPDTISTVNPDVYNGYVKDNSLRYDEKLGDLQTDLRVTPQAEPHYVKENPLLLDPDLKIKHDEPFVPRKLPKLPNLSEKISPGYVSAKDPMVNKRLNLSSISSNGDDMGSPDSALSPEAYCRFGWNSESNLDDGTDFESLLENKLILDKSKDKKLNEDKNSYLPINTNLSKE